MTSGYGFAGGWASEWVVVWGLGECTGVYQRLRHPLTTEQGDGGEGVGTNTTPHETTQKPQRGVTCIDGAN